MDSMVAALYVEPDGPYANLDGVEVWDEARDAMNYTGPYPVVAHPPCNRWSVMAACRPGHRNGEDGGCFAAALATVRRVGGVLEHPASSLAWKRFGLLKPPSSGGWVNADWLGGWTCCVAQRNYGHLARKRTWLYAVGIDLETLLWGDGPEPVLYIADNGHKRPEIHKLDRSKTPEPFRDLLLSMARSVHAPL